MATVCTTKKYIPTLIDVGIYFFNYQKPGCGRPTSSSSSWVPSPLPGEQRPRP